jgi:hypothetical protein
LFDTAPSGSCLHALAIGAFTRGKASRVMTYLSFIIAFAPIVSARLN